MNVKDALHHAVHDYKDGVEGLARRMGLAVPTLYGMANPNNTENGWPLKRFQQVLQFTGDMRPLHSLCEENGGVFVPVVEKTGTMSGSLEKLANLAAEFGDVARHAHDAMRDGKLTPRELQEFDTQIFELIQAAAALSLQMRKEGEKGGNLRVAK